MTDHSLVIIGSGQAGATVAREFRKLDKTTSVCIITADKGGFYSKPMLSNAFQKKMPLDKLMMQDATTFDEKNQTKTLNFHRVNSLDVDNKQLSVTDEAQQKTFSITYNNLVLALGAESIAAPFAGGELTYSINSHDDYLSLRQELAKLSANSTIGIIGGGLIGCELANDLSLGGFNIDLFEQAEYLMQRIAHQNASIHLEKALSGIGITIHTNTQVQSISTNDSGLKVNFQPKDQVASAKNYDLLITALGLKPKIQLAKNAGIKCNHGIECDRYLATSAPNVYAIGDCLEVQKLTLPYILPIMEGAKALAATLTGNPTALKYPSMPVAVKTPACPMVVCPPVSHILKSGSQTLTVESANNTPHESHTLYRLENGSQVGFSLTGSATQKRALEAKQTLGYFEQIKN